MLFILHSLYNSVMAEIKEITDLIAGGINKKEEELERPFEEGEIQ